MSDGSCTTKGHSMDVLMLLHQSYAGSNSLSNKLWWTRPKLKHAGIWSAATGAELSRKGHFCRLRLAPQVTDLCVLLRSDTLKWPIWNHCYFETAQSKATSHENVKCMLAISCIIDFTKSHLLVTISKITDGGRNNNSNKSPSIPLDQFNYFNFYLKITLWFYLPSLR